MDVLKEKTRIKLTYALILLGLLEALLKYFLKEFPLTELYAFQAMAGGGYFTVKTINNSQEVKRDQDNCVDK